MARALGCPPVHWLIRRTLEIRSRRVRDRQLKRGRHRPQRRGGVGRKLAALLPAPLFALVLVVSFGFIAAGSAYAYFAQGLPSAADFERDPLPLSTKVYARDGSTLLYEFAEQRREPVKYDELPQALIDATISAEDKTFWTNPGVDMLGIARAAFYDFFRRGDSRPQGASTITQQLVKLRLVGSDVSVERKIKEALVAVEVTRTYSKKEILQLYFNQIYYGSQAYGVKAAALVYFGTTDLSTLTLAQLALLAGLPQAPSDFDPTKPEHIPQATERRAYVLDQMVENGYITRAAATDAKADPMKITGRPLIDIRAPHFVFQVKTQLARILGSEAAISRGGYAVVTPLEWPKQQEAEKQVTKWVEDLHNRNVFNAALVTIDPQNGEVLAYVGSVDYYNVADPKVQGQFDVAGLGERQPGSAFKVFNYLTALKNGATPATVVVDARTDFEGKDDGSFRNPRVTCGYCPENADLLYRGPITMRQAIRESRNVPAVKFLHYYSGIEATIETARDMGISADFAKAQAGLSLTLGSVPVKLLDMTSAYGVLANMGVRADPTFVLKVTDRDGRTTWEHKDFETRQVLKPELAWLMNDILKDTTTVSTVFSSWTGIGRPAALKTGTTDDLKDVYSVGYTPQVVTGIWMGNNDQTSMDRRDFFSAMGPGQLWRDYMKAILKDLPVADWPRPANIVEARVAVAGGASGGYGSGLVPSAHSPFSITEKFIKGTQPTREDDWFGFGCPDVFGQRKVVMVLKEPGPDVWARYRNIWVANGMAGRYGSFWQSVLSTGGPCPSPLPSPSGGGPICPTCRPAPTPTRQPGDSQN